MSVTTETNRTAEFTTDGVVTDFDFGMLIYSTLEVQVWYKVTGGNYAELTLNTDYGVVFTEDGGTVSTDGYRAPLAGGTLLIIRHLALTQQTNWLYNDNHTEQTHQDDFDRAVMRDLQIQEQLDHCPKFSIHSSTTNITFPELVANMIVGVNSVGDDLTLISRAAATAGIPEYLNDLLDVSITTPANNDILHYDSGIWVNTDSPTLDTLTVTSDITVGGDLDATGVSTFGGTLYPSVSGTYDLGFPGEYWRGLYLSNIAIIDTLTLSSGSIRDSGGLIDFDIMDLVTVGDIYARHIYAISVESTGASYRALGDSTAEIDVRRTVKDLSATVSGSGSMYAGGNFSQASDLNYKIEIDTAGEIGTATFKWSDDGGSTWDDTEVTTSVGFVDLNNEIKVWFQVGAGTDFEFGDYWTFTAIGTDNQVNTFQVDTTNNKVIVGGTLAVDTINEYTGAAGVTIDGVVLKDGGITLPTTSEINFRDSDISIGSAFDGKLDISADISVGFFYDNADVGDAVDGQSLYINRRAAEGDDYLQFYIDSDRYAIINANQTLKIQRQGSTLLLLAANALTVNGSLIINNQAVADDARGLSSITKLVTNAKSDGIAGYFEGHIDGTTDGPTYGLGAWLNVDSGSVTQDIRGLDVGIYESGANCTGGNAYGLAIHLEFDNANSPAAIYPIRLNTNVAGATPDALIFAANKKAVPITESGFPGVANAYTKIVIQDGTVYRIPVIDESDIGGDFGSTNLETTGTLSAGATTFDSLDITGGLTADTDTLVVDAVNHRVGIGTASPQVTLHIKPLPNLGGAGGLISGTTATTTGAMRHKFDGNLTDWFGIYNANTALYYGFSAQLPAPAGTSTVGGYYKGLGIGGSVTGTADPIFGVLNSGQSGEGIGNVAFTIKANNTVETFSNKLDNGSGGVDIAYFYGGDAATTFSNETITLTFSNAGNYPHFIHTRHNDGAGTNNAIDFYTSDGTAAGTYPANAVHGITINNGKVGIGTASPVKQLHIAGSGTSVIRLSDTGASTDTQVNAITEYYRGTNTNRVGWAGFGSSFNNDYAITNQISGGDITLMPTATGKVGIGESSPQDKLEVNGTVLVKGALKYTQDDGNEAITGALNDGYLDYLATTAHRFNNDVLIANTKVLKVNSIQVVGAQQAHIADATTQDLAGSDTVDETKLESDLADIVTKLNAIFTALETHGLLATA